MKRKSAFVLLILVLVAFAAIPWLFIWQTSPVPGELIAQPTVYQVRRAIQQTVAAQIQITAGPTVEATVFDVLSPLETTEEVVSTKTP